MSSPPDGKRHSTSASPEPAASSTDEVRCNENHHQQTLTFKQQMDGFPYGQMFIISLIRFSEPVSFTSLFPYVYYMVRDFKIAPHEEDIPKYTSYLASSFALAQFLFAVHWGKLADRIGRKPVLLCGLAGTSISLVIFGFSANFAMALSARCLAGCLNGNVSVLRTVIGEIATERRHQALAFSTLPLLFNLGSVIGPAIGGSRLFTRPSPHNPYQDDGTVISTTYEGFVSRYPYAMSNIVVCSLLWFSLLCGVLFLQETHEVLKARRDVGIEWGDWFLSKAFGMNPPKRPWHDKSSVDELAPLLNSSTSSLSDNSIDQSITDDSSGSTAMVNEPPQQYVESNNADDQSIKSQVFDEEDEEDEQELGPYISQTISRAIVRTYSQSEQPDPEPLDHSENPYANAFTLPVIQAIAANFLISLHSNVYAEFLPVFLAARFQPHQLKFPFHITGGFGLDVSTIGTLFSSTGVMGMLIVLIIFPWIDRRLGTITGFRLSVAIFPVVYLLVPWAIFTLHGYNHAIPAWVTPVVLYALTSFRTLASATGMPQVMLLQHRAVRKRGHRAYVNSSTMSIIALARFVGPLVFGWLMSLGDAHGKSWIMWWVLALWAACGFVQALMMRDYDEEPAL